MNGLLEFHSLTANFERTKQVFVLPSFITPGYWAALAAYCKFKDIKFDEIKFHSEKRKNYAAAIALESALGATDSYPYERKNSGATYSPLVPLSSADDTDTATSTINNCIRHLFTTPNLSHFVKDLCDVVGDLHDNVWSHGKSTGFSLAQKWQDYNSHEYCLEFALADCGLGFLRELNRVGLNIQDDEEAINWCITRGNSSKKLKVKDEWSQRLPSDMTNNPIPGIGQAVASENNHMGIGLAKLIELVHNYKGQLWLSSGKKMLFIDNNGKRSYKNFSQQWQGVALACRFDTKNAMSYTKSNNDEITSSLVELLKV